MTPKQYLIKLKLEKGWAEHPNWPKYYIPIPTYSDKTANGLTKMIIDLIKLLGGQAERISNTGRYVVIKGPKDEVFNRNFDTGKWIKGSGTKGTADISAIVRGKTLKIEVKIGKDRQSDEQRKYQQSVESAGGIYVIAKDFNTFALWLFDLFNIEWLTK